MISFRFLSLVVFSLMLTACFSCNDNNKKSDTSPPVKHPFVTWEKCSQDIGDPACNFELLNQHGEVVELYDQYGKVVVVDLSVMWCGPCRDMSIASETIVADYGEDKLSWLTLIIENEYGDAPSQQDLQRWAAATGVTGHVLAASRDIIDNDFPFEDGYPVGGWPTFYVIDSGLIVQYGTQGWSDALVRYQIDSLLQ